MPSEAVLPLKDGLVAPAERLVYHPPVSLQRDRLLQIARLVGAEAFAERFGPPQTAQPDLDALRALVEERLDQVAQRLVEEAAASDDVIDAASAAAYLEDRLRTLGDVLTPGQAERIRAAFEECTVAW